MMETHILSNILVLGGDQSLCGALSNLGCHVSASATPARSEAEPSGSGCYEIMIVDLQELDKAGVALIEKAVSKCPYARIIGIKPPGAQDGYPDLGLNFFRCFEKPVEPECLSYAVRDALEIRAREQIISAMVKELDARNNELADQRRRFDFLNRKLLKNNDVASIVTENIQRECEDAGKRVAQNLRSIVIPSIDKLKKIKGLEPYSSEFDLIISEIEDMTSNIITDVEIVSKLTPAELRVVSLIRNGLNSGEIARRLNLSPDTIKCHRKRIRKKLGINKAGFSLKNFLEIEDSWNGDNSLAVNSEGTRF